jgi:hypothetical protein
LDRRLGGPQNQSGQRGENSWPYQDTNSNPFSSSQQPDALPTGLSRPPTTIHK